MLKQIFIIYNWKELDPETELHIVRLLLTMGQNVFLSS